MVQYALTWMIREGGAMVTTSKTTNLSIELTCLRLLSHHHLKTTSITYSLLDFALKCERTLIFVPHEVINYSFANLRNDVQKKSFSQVGPKCYRIFEKYV